jgi:FKBP-type peptidyl-prolyl cis-trans isomerase FklB
MSFTKSLAVLTAVSLFTFSSFAQTKPKAKAKAPVSAVKVLEKPFKSAMDSVSYAVGVMVAQNIKSQKLLLNSDMVTKGFTASTTGVPLLISEQACQAVVNNYLIKNQQEQAALAAKQAEPNRLAGEQFLAANKTKPTVITTASGLQYEVIKMGEGPKPTPQDKVLAHYHGTLIDGSVFDSSVQRGTPVPFQVLGVIPGWTEALQLMPVGSKFKLYIPQQLAYAEGGGGIIKPYSALIFEVELISIEK